MIIYVYRQLSLINNKTRLNYANLFRNKMIRILTIISREFYNLITQLYNSTFITLPSKTHQAPLHSLQNLTKDPQGLYLSRKLKQPYNRQSLPVSSSNCSPVVSIGL